MVYAVYNNVVLAFRIHSGRCQNIEDRSRSGLQFCEVGSLFTEDHTLQKRLFGSFFLCALRFRRRLLDFFRRCIAGLLFHLHDYSS